MDITEFNRIISKQLIKVENMLLSKGDEYAPDKSDRLHNFRAAAAMQGVTPRDALGGMMIKHTVSVYDMIGDSTGTHSLEKWEEKITDHITYLVCLRAVIEEEFNEAAKTDPDLQRLRDQLNGNSDYGQSLHPDEPSEAGKEAGFESNVRFAPQPAVSDPKTPFDGLDPQE